MIAGYMVYLHPHRVQILGYTEISYLRGLKPEEGERIVKELCGQDVACFIVTRNLKVPESLLRETEETAYRAFADAGSSPPSSSSG